MQVGRGGLNFSDPNGFYAMRHMDVGAVTITFFCPSRRPLGGRQFATRQLRVQRTTDSLVNFVVPAAGCVEPPIERVLRTFSGHYTWGWENSAFVGCEPFGNLEGTAYDGLRTYAWVSWEALWRLIPADSMPEVPNSGFQERRWYVEWRGWLLGPGSYGHMGGAIYDFTPTELITIRAPRVDDCS